MYILLLSQRLTTINFLLSHFRETKLVLKNYYNHDYVYNYDYGYACIDWFNYFNMIYNMSVNEVMLLILYV